MEHPGLLEALVGEGRGGGGIIVLSLPAVERWSSEWGRRREGRGVICSMPVEREREIQMYITNRSVIEHPPPYIHIQYHNSPGCKNSPKTCTGQYQTSTHTVHYAAEHETGLTWIAWLRAASRWL